MKIRKSIADRWRLELTTIERRIIQTIYNEYKEKNEWPLSRHMAVKFIDNGDYFELVNNMSHQFIIVGNPEDAKAVSQLTIYSIMACEGSENHIELFIRAYNYILKSFRENPDLEKITDKDFRRDLNFNNDDIKFVYDMNNSLWITSGLSWSHLSRELTLHVRFGEILKYKPIRTIDEFIYQHLDYLPTRFGGKYKPHTNAARLVNIQSEQLVKKKTHLKHFRESQQNHVFILMAMSEDPLLDEVHQKVKEVCKEMGLNAIRADDLPTSGNITEEVLENIRKSEFIIVDLSLERPNVYYELGYAHGLNFGPYDLILMAKVGTPLHFDIRNQRTIFYKLPSEMKKKLKTRLKANIDVRK